MKAMLFVVAILLAPFAPSLAAEVPAGNAELKLGDVNFPVSCHQQAQEQFNRATAILHSFWYEEAAKAFSAVAEADPDCAMAYWGVAMSNWYELWSPPTNEALKAGSAAIAKAEAIGAKTDRERDYIAAIAIFYRDSDKLDHRTRAVAYEKAMEQLYLHYPDDGEAAVFYALALDATALPTDTTFANQKKAATILEKIFVEQPSHPGVAHYLIHSYDSAPLAQLGLPAAICYGQIAPAVPHALHMPSHIFTRVGRWQDSIDANRKAAEAGQEYAARQFGDGVAWDQSLHAMDYLEYALLQLAEDREAKKVVDSVMAFQKATPESLGAAYALAAIPARYAVERHDWVEAADVAAPSMPFSWERFAWTPALVSFARALGAAHTGDFASAQSEIDKLQTARDAVKPKNKYWADQIEVERLAATAVFEHAQGKDGAALVDMRRAVDLDASMDKNNVTPGAIVPSRELLGDLLLELNEPSEALTAYEQTLAAEPNRFRSLYGAAKAAERSGDAAKAKAYYQQLASLGSHAKTERPELAEAKAYLGQ